MYKILQLLLAPKKNRDFNVQELLRHWKVSSELQKKGFAMNLLDSSNADKGPSREYGKS